MCIHTQIVYMENYLSTVYLYIHMATKTISITEEVYDELSRLKGPEESFSDELRRLAKSKGRISECAGLWARWMSKEEIDKIENNIEQRRKLSRLAKSEKRLQNERG